MLSDVIAPYEIGDLGAPLSEWEKSDAALTDKFRAEFPDGKVPVRYVPKMGTRTSDPYEWASNLLTAYDTAKDAVRSVDDCARLREEYRATYGHHYDHYGTVEPMERLQARNRSVRSLIYQGLTIRQVARYLGATPEQIGRMIFTRTPKEEPFPTHLLDVDEHVKEWMQQGKPKPLVDLARELDVNPRRVRALVRLREKGALYEEKESHE